MKRIAAVAGATGLVGSECVRVLLERAAFESVIALVRRPTGITHPRFTQLIIDYRHVELPPVTDVFCALGTTIRKAGTQTAFREVDYEYPRRLAEQSVRSGVRRFAMVSSIGANPQSANFYLRVKGELEQAVRELPIESIHIFRPSLLLGDRAERRPQERMAMAIAPLFSFALLGPLQRYHPIRAADLAAAMVATLEEGSPGFHVYEYAEIMKLSRRRAAR